MFKVSQRGLQQKGRTYRRFILRQLGHLLLERPAAFRPLLMEGLALSGEPVQLLFFISENVEFVNQKKAL
jgi:hypothetical protein